MFDPMIMMFLCPSCRHGNACPGQNKQASAGGGFTCGSYRPKPDRRAKMSPPHVMALPDREPCDDCACRKGTVPNGTPHTIADFMLSVEELQPFLCHGDGHGRICSGWLRAAKARVAALSPSGKEG